VSLHAYFLNLLFNPEDGSDMSLRISAGYTALWGSEYQKQEKKNISGEYRAAGA
jgi:hypothetical protein